MSELAVYTANFNNYDVLYDPCCLDHPYVCFADARSPSLDRGAWRAIVVPMRQATPGRESRWYKTHSHELFAHAGWTLYMDASLQMRACPLDFLQWCGGVTRKPGCDLYLFRHPERDCLYAEAEICIQLGKDTRQNIEPQLAKYRQMSFPEHHGLWWSGVLLRRNTPGVRQLNEMWWWEILNGSHRDQLSLPVVLEFSRIDFATLPPDRVTDWFLWRADHSKRQV